MTLQSPSAIGLSEVGGALSMLITSSSEPGMTALRVDPQADGGMIAADATGGVKMAPMPMTCWSAGPAMTTCAVAPGLTC